ncbi:uncharacterized protein PHALS_06309 [Plasmopara halstedii]|uniref:Uncharacterized protein n=1 Tax=Plasmopara halstedii TaxID=4781 RepID=A0A0P1B4H1_PLAHL|nr:uncharacterized protein PHALS_06309 [Plasmopara halstedii]CEG48490.1 hypothetical protein PHALS_06309 [Plasmopara halstedii]|eukprot:XP_024584859.1 hypothetical protein PHALS_06309 [Plasmopara halstedii]
MFATPVAASSVSSSVSSQRQLQGLVTRRTATVEPKSAAQYFGHVADVVRTNEGLTKMRIYNLKRRAKVAYKGYESVLSRKKRPIIGSIKPLVNSSRPAPSTAMFNPAAVLQLQAMLPRAQPVAVKPAPKIAVATSMSSVIPSTTLANPASGQMSAAQFQLRQQQTKNTQHQVPKRSDFVVGSTVHIRSTADLIACGARNLAGKTGRVVAAPQIYGQELFSVYIDEHEALFQVPFNALTLTARPTSTKQQHTHNTQHIQTPQTGSAGRSDSHQMQGPQNANIQASSGSKSADAKMEHSFQLHRLMQKQYREIQVLQQRYAECRVINPSALSGIQKELSKLRLVHLSQVQTLKSKQSLDRIGK